jgi:hypothetical protein
VAAPPISGHFFGVFHAGGIEMNIADELQKIGVPIAKDRLVAALKKMADGAVTAVVVLGIGKLVTLEDFGQRGIGVRPAFVSYLSISSAIFVSVPAS